MALIEEFLGKRDVPCLPGAEGQGGQKWVRNVSYFRELIAAWFLKPWQGLLKGFTFSLSFSSTPFSLRNISFVATVLETRHREMSQGAERD